MITLDWGVDAQSEWQALLAGARCGLQQSWSYGEALRAGGVRVKAAILRDGASRSAIGCMQIADRRLLGPCGASFLLRGPVWFIEPPSADVRPSLLQAVRDRSGAAC